MKTQALLASITLALAGSAFAAGDKLEATGSFKVGPGTKAVAIVTVAGKPSTARFTLK